MLLKLVKFAKNKFIWRRLKWIEDTKKLCSVFININGLYTKSNT